MVNDADCQMRCGEKVIFSKFIRFQINSGDKIKKTPATLDSNLQLSGQFM